MSLRATGVALLLAAVVASAVAVVYARHQSRALFIDLRALEHERDELNVEFGRLQLEQATWAETNRVEQIARSRLGMRPADPAATVVIRR
ncbi:MAG TPA: cell division protein FtsL [Xanthomonadaceae bacterium]|nr:cell division protein FtsL [Xanthomonadaceae bacterium]